MRDASSNLLSEVKCTLLPGKYTNQNRVPDLYNSVYDYWRSTWSEFFRKAGSPPGALNIENFMRHSFIITLHHDKEIVGTLLSSVFNLSAHPTFDHPCISPFPQDVLNRLKARGEGQCITGEYLSVCPKFKKEVMGVSMAEVMIGVLMKIFQTQKMEMALAATVRAAKVDSICKAYGYEEVGSYMKIGVDCVMLYNTQQSCKVHPNAEVSSMVDRCWNQRSDATGLTITNTIENQIAA